MTETTPRILHCWEEGPRTADDCGTTCMLEAGHDGPHEWTRDDGIVVGFAPLDGREHKEFPDE